MLWWCYGTLEEDLASPQKISWPLEVLLCGWGGWRSPWIPLAVQRSLGNTEWAKWPIMWSFVVYMVIDGLLESWNSCMVFDMEVKPMDNMPLVCWRNIESITWSLSPQVGWRNPGWHNESLEVCMELFHSCPQAWWRPWCIIESIGWCCISWIHI